MKLQIFKSINNESNAITKFIHELYSSSNSSSKKMKKRNIDGILYLASHLGDSHYQHRVYDECICLTQKHMYNIFGSDNYRYKINNKDNHVFNKLFYRWHVGNNIDGNGGSAYFVNTDFQTALLEWIVTCDHSNDELIDCSIDDSQYNKYDATSHIHLNINAINDRIDKNMLDLKKYLNSCNIEKQSIDLDDYEVINAIKMIDENRDYKDKLLHETMILKYILAKSVNGVLELQYKCSDSGRYYGFGSYHLQSIKKNVRNFILSDYYSYDIESASPVVLSQLYARITGKQIPKTIQYYIDNKSSFRVALALFAQTNLDDAKMIFNMLFFGAKTNENDLYEYTSIAELIGVKTNKMLLNNRFFKLLVRDIKSMFKIIGDYYKHRHAIKKNGIWVIENDKGKIIEMKKWNNGKVVAHVYQGIESIILDTCINYYREQHNDDASYLMIHDGFYSKHELNISILENVIYEKTGYKVHYESRTMTLTHKQIFKTFNVFDIAVAKCQQIAKEKMAS